MLRLQCFKYVKYIYFLQNLFSSCCIKKKSLSEFYKWISTVVLIPKLVFSVQVYLRQGSYFLFSFCFHFFWNCHWNVLNSVTKALHFCQSYIITFCMNKKKRNCCHDISRMTITAFFTLLFCQTRSKTGSCVFCVHSGQCVWDCWVKFFECALSMLI